jgi:hypothetical protein
VIHAQEVVSTPPGSVLTEARTLLKEGAHQAAIELLRPAIEQMVQELAANRENLREAYLLLINTQVQRSKKFFKDGDPPSGRLYREDAKSTIVECLETPGLSDTAPDPARDPAEVLDLFDEVRREIFGTFRVIELDPPEAMVHLDGEYLGTGDGGLPITRSNLASGFHLVVVRAEGYKDYTDEIEMSAGTILDVKYELEGKPGWGTWTMRAVVAGAAAAVVVSLTKKESSSPGALPEPPPPPE